MFQSYSMLPFYSASLKRHILFHVYAIAVWMLSYALNFHSFEHPLNTQLEVEIWSWDMLCLARFLASTCVESSNVNQFHPSFPCLFPWKHAIVRFWSQDAGVRAFCQWTRREKFGDFFQLVYPPGSQHIYRRIWKWSYLVQFVDLTIVMLVY